jgi:xanthine/CO dehydrogenase XdhC/CoxF family maturation factor
MTFTELRTVLDAALAARRDRPDVPLALATLVAVDGSSYRQPGARMLCDADGRVLAGAISGGCLEADVAARVAELGDSGTLLRYDLREDLETIWGFGAGCDGVAHVLLATLTDLAPLEQAVETAAHRRSGVLLMHVDGETQGRLEFARDTPPHATAALVFDTVQRTGLAYLAHATDATRLLGTPVRPPVHLLVIGATRGAEAMARIAHATGWQVTVVDHRDAALTALSLPAGVAVRTIAPHEADAAFANDVLPGDARTVTALCTHRFEHDAAWLEAALRTQSPYIGLLGSRQRGARLLQTLADANSRAFAEHARRVYAPIGLDLGGESPDEIALAAVAEAQAVLHGRAGGSLRLRQTPLHTRTETPAISATDAAATCAIDEAPHG